MGDEGAVETQTGRGIIIISIHASLKLNAVNGL
jgi:hypothetical protein